MANIKPSLTENELNLIISSLLFSSSVNVISNTQEMYQRSLIDLAIKLKEYKPSIKLENLQFIEEENYEDQWSSDILKNFKDNIEIVNFDQV
jgi:hypothetical protein